MVAKLAMGPRYLEGEKRYHVAIRHRTGGEVFVEYRRMGGRGISVGEISLGIWLTYGAGA